MTQTEIRQSLLRNGHLPIPVQGKRPLLQNWQNLSPNEEMIDGWGDTGNNTGVLCKRTAALDVDIDDADAVQIVLSLARKEFCGVFLERYGRPPKCAVPMQVPTPLKKAIRKLTASDGRVHKIEFLCDGQQFVVSGTHPDTGQAYRWKDFDLTKIDVSHLPIATEAKVSAFLDGCVEELKDRLGWSDVSNAGSAEIDPMPRVPQEERFKQTEYGGAFGINQTILELPMKRHDEGIPCEEVIKELRELVRAAFDKLPSEHPERATWDWRASDQRGRPSPNGRPFTFAFKVAMFTSTSVAVDVLPSRFHTLLVVSGQMQLVFFVGVVVRGKCIGHRRM